MNLGHTKEGITLRAIAPEDEPFLGRLYASTRAEELDQWGWDAAMREHFLAMQRRAFEHGLAGVGGDDRVVLAGDAPAGRLIVKRSPEEIRLVDIALLPEHRDKGIGTMILGELIEEARRSRKPLRLSALTGGRALEWYRRHGFGVVADAGVHTEMEWRGGSLEEARA